VLRRTIPFTAISPDTAAKCSSRFATQRPPIDRFSRSGLPRRGRVVRTKCCPRNQTTSPKAQSLPNNCGPLAAIPLADVGQGTGGFFDAKNRIQRSLSRFETGPPQFRALATWSPLVCRFFLAIGLPCRSSCFSFGTRYGTLESRGSRTTQVSKQNLKRRTRLIDKQQQKSRTIIASPIMGKRFAKGSTNPSSRRLTITDETAGDRRSEFKLSTRKQLEFEFSLPKFFRNGWRTREIPSVGQFPYENRFSDDSFLRHIFPPEYRLTDGPAIVPFDAEVRKTRQAALGHMWESTLKTSTHRMKAPCCPTGRIS